MKLKKCGRKLGAFLAAALLLGGCSGQPGAEGKQTDTEAADSAAVQMGRYVEEYTQSNAELGRCTSLTRLEDGRLAVFSYHQGPYISEDEGMTWEPWQSEWYRENCDFYSYRCAAIAPDGTIFAGYIDYSEEMQQEAETENGEQETETQAEDPYIDFEIRMDYQLIAPDGSCKRIEMEQLNGRNGENFMTECWYAPDKTLYAADLEYVYEVGEDGETLTPLFGTGDEYAVQLCFLGEDTMLAMTAQEVLIYDRKSRTLQDGDEVLDAFVRQIAQDNGSVLKRADDSYSLYLVAGENETLYLACSEGIYSHVLGGGVMEQVLEGSLCTMGDPSQGIYGMQLYPENRFYVLYRDACGLYAYDAAMPTLPEKELKIYSLEKDDVVQQAVSLFQKAHQDVYVNYEIGLEENSGQTKEDVIKALNAEILAGNGPDVLILDGFPIKSYLEKGLLQDVSGVLQQAAQKEAFFENIVYAFAEEEKVYAVPLRCRIPVVIGPAEEIEKAADLEGLADAAGSLRGKKESGSVTGCVAAEPTLRLLAMASAPAWEKEDGSADLEAVREFYRQAQRFFEAEDAGVTQEERESWDAVSLSDVDGSLKDDAWMLIDHNAYQVFLQPDRMGLGYAEDMWGMEVLFSVRRQGTELECDTLKGQAQQVFYPYTIAGISASARESALAEQFLETMLSAEAARQTGFSVNRTALENQISLNDDGEGGILGAMVVADENGTMKELAIWQLTEQEVDWLYETMEGLTTPYLQNETLESAVLEAGEKLLRGELDLDAALEAVQDRVKLSLAE